MPRPRKWKKVCCLPEADLFGPLTEGGQPVHFVTMTVEEYETIRLIDLEGLTQEECAERMEVARGTVQFIYKEARFKIAEAIVNGYKLKIAGGSYKLYNDDEKINGCQRCQRCRKKCCNEIAFDEKIARDKTSQDKTSLDKTDPRDER